MTDPRDGRDWFDRLDASRADGTTWHCGCGQENPGSDDRCIECRAANAVGL